MLRRRRPHPLSNSQRVTDDEFLAILRDGILSVAPALVNGCRIRDGLMIGKPAWSIMMLPIDPDDPSHFDIGFAPALGSGLPAFSDHIGGPGSGPDAAERAAHICLETSGACFLEMLTRRGQYADHLDGNDRAGIPGWHTVASGILAYSEGDDDSDRVALQHAMADNSVLNRLSDVLVPLVTQPANNGIKMLYLRGADSMVAEVSVNGVRDETASDALAGLAWPAVKAPTVARCYAVATSPE
jgi:hypothetical protein